MKKTKTNFNVYDIVKNVADVPAFQCMYEFEPYRNRSNSEKLKRFLLRDCGCSKANYRQLTIGSICTLYFREQCRELFESEDRAPPNWEDCAQIDFAHYRTFKAIWPLFEEITNNPSKLYDPAKPARTGQTELFEFFRRITWGEYKDYLLNLTSNSEEENAVSNWFTRLESSVWWGYWCREDTFLDILLRYKFMDDSYYSHFACVFLAPFVSPKILFKLLQENKVLN